MADLDGLKCVNDTHGHQAGDRVIVKTKEILVRVYRQSDTLIRWGGAVNSCSWDSRRIGARPPVWRTACVTRSRTIGSTSTTAKAFT